MTVQPRHDIGHAARRLAGRQVRAVDQDHGKAKRAGGGQFRIRAAAACVLGDDMGDGVLAHQGFVGLHREGAFGEDHGRIGQGKRGFGRIDEAQKVVVLRFGGEGVEGLLADGEEDAGRGVGQGRDSGFGRGDMGPAVALCRRPSGAFEGEERGSGFGAGGEGITAHLRGKGVGGVDHMGDGIAADVSGEAFGTAKAADAGGQGLGHGGIGAACVGENRVDALAGEFGGEAGGFRRAAEKKDARHG